MYIATCIYMGLMSVWDWRKKSIPLPLIVFGMVAGCLVSTYQVCMRYVLWQEVLVAVVPGALLLLLAYVTREQIGYGDGLVLLVLGFLLGWRCSWFAFVTSQLLAGVCALCLLVSKKIGRKTRIAYIPFLFAGIILCKAVVV